MPRIGLVSTFSCECGISTYSEHLSEHYPEGDCVIFGNHFGVVSDVGYKSKHPVVRCWTRTSDFTELEAAIFESGVKLVHFQHEFGLFQNKAAFIRLLKNLTAYDRVKVVITFHTIFNEKDLNVEVNEIAKYCSIIIAHHENALEYMEVNNARVIPHGSVVVDKIDKVEARKRLSIPLDKIVLLCLGFITPNKRSIESASAVLRLRDEYRDKLQLYVVGAPITHGQNFGNFEYCLNLFKRVKAMNGFNIVNIMPRFISEEEMALYGSAADIAIENYGQTHFSTSGMSHFVMSCGLPSVSSESNILLDLIGRSLKFGIGDVPGLSNRLDELIKNKNLMEDLAKKGLDYASETSWANVAKMHYGHYNGFIPAKEKL